MDDGTVLRDNTQKVYYGRGDRVDWSRPVAAHDLQLALLEFMRTSDFGYTATRFSEGYAPALEGDVIGDRPLYFRDEFLVPGLRASLNGMAQYVSAEICDLVTAIADTMPPEMLFPTDLMFFDGLLVLGKKLPLKQHNLIGDARRGRGPIVEGEPQPEGPILAPGEHTLNITAIGYSQMESIRTRDDHVGPGIQLSLYATQHDATTMVHPEVLERGQWPNPNTPYGRAPLILADHVVWAYGTPWGEAKLGERVTSQNTAPKVSYLRRWLLALWRLMWQEILHPDPFKLDRPAVKRAQRLMPQRIPGDILRVIRLRRIDETVDEYLPDAGPGRVLTHGHWRRAHWRTIHRDTADERKVYVKGCVVRPDLPIAESYQVVSVER